MQAGSLVIACGSITPAFGVVVMMNRPTALYCNQRTSFWFEIRTQNLVIMKRSANHGDDES